MSAGCRIGRVKFKSGGELHIIHADTSTRRHELMADINQTLDDMKGFELHGFAFVVWGEEGANGSNAHAWGGLIARSMIPEWARAILISHHAAREVRANIEDAQ